MNTKSIFALLPLDIKEVISDKLCEPDKQIHKSVMENLLKMNVESMIDRYEWEILEFYNLIEPEDEYRYAGELPFLYKKNKEFFDDLHTRVALCQNGCAQWKDYKSLRWDWIKQMYHSILPSFVKKWGTPIKLISDSDSDCDNDYYIVTENGDLIDACTNAGCSSPLSVAPSHKLNNA
tara:strand:+ start:112 stop:645 length:534 start_codon:yes stop_codon:yes gene_type:complete